MVLDKKTKDKIRTYIRLQPFTHVEYEHRRNIAIDLAKHPKIDEVKELIERLSPPKSLKQRLQIEMYGN